jgi:hypothetical protein
MTHAARRAPWVATVHDAVKESGRVVPRPSVVFHMYALADTPWVVWTLFDCTPVKRGKVSSSSVTHEATMFAGPHESRMLQYTTQTCSPGLDDWTLIDIGRGYILELWIYNPFHFQPSHAVFSTSPSCPTRSPITPKFPSTLLNPHRTSIDIKGPITSGFRPLVFYR